jgi:hypothetical protein
MIDYEQLFKFIEAGDNESAGKLIDSYLSAEVTAEEKGAMYMAMASAYMEMQNRINERYADILEENTAELKRMDEEEKLLLEDIDLTAARNQINGA